jgi:hypothetical protein
VAETLESEGSRQRYCRFVVTPVVLRNPVQVVSLSGFIRSRLEDLQTGEYSYGRLWQK